MDRGAACLKEKKNRISIVISGILKSLSVLLTRSLCGMCFVWTVSSVFNDWQKEALKSESLNESFTVFNKWRKPSQRWTRVAELKCKVECQPLEFCMVFFRDSTVDDGICRRLSGREVLLDVLPDWTSYKKHKCLCGLNNSKICVEFWMLEGEFVFGVITFVKTLSTCKTEKLCNTGHLKGLSECMWVQGRKYWIIFWRIQPIDLRYLQLGKWTVCKRRYLKRTE